MRDTEEERKHNLETRAKIKLEFLQAYGFKCACCGETDIRFLTLDHINGNGSEDRNKNGVTGDKILYLAKREGWPKDKYQCLCWNCNCGRQHNGGICPHKSDRSGQDALVAIALRASGVHI